MLSVQLFYFTIVTFFNILLKNLSPFDHFFHVECLRTNTKPKYKMREVDRSQFHESQTYESTFLTSFENVRAPKEKQNIQFVFSPHLNRVTFFPLGYIYIYIYF